MTMITMVTARKEPKLAQKQRVALPGTGGRRPPKIGERWKPVQPLRSLRSVMLQKRHDLLESAHLSVETQV